MIRSVATTGARLNAMQMITNTRAYAIGEMSRLARVNIETIRYYERIKIMPKPDRTEGGNRQYNHEQLKRLSFIKKCRNLGFSLDDIRTLLEMVDRDDFSCYEILDIAISHLTKIKQKLEALKQLERNLKDMAAQCSKGDMPNCPMIDSLFELN
jgi:MerR family mercuric resistance operon transcriptional regulator